MLGFIIVRKLAAAETMRRRSSLLIVIKAVCSFFPGWGLVFMAMEHNTPLLKCCTHHPVPVHRLVCQEITFQFPWDYQRPEQDRAVNESMTHPEHQALLNVLAWECKWWEYSRRKWSHYYRILPLLPHFDSVLLCCVMLQHFAATQIIGTDSAVEKRMQWMSQRDYGAKQQHRDRSEDTWASDRGGGGSDCDLSPAWAWH